MKNTANARPAKIQLTSTRRALYLIGSILLLWTGAAQAATHNVQVGGEYGPYFWPKVIAIQPGDTVNWNFYGREHAHTVTFNGFGSGRERFGPYTYSHTFHASGRFDYFCGSHVGIGFDQTGSVYVGIPAPPQPLNLSTRLRVQTGEKVLIGGFIITLNAPKRVLVRAIGPSLGGVGIAGALADPIMSLVNRYGAVIASNDNWRSHQQAEIQATGIPPSDDREAAIIATLLPESYTAIVEGKNGSTGIGLVEVYDLEPGADSKLTNISTRGFVDTGNNVLIGGFILGRESGMSRIVVRALGPSLSAAGVDGALADPALELRNSNGELVRGNRNWRDDQEAEITQTGIPPQDDRESAVTAMLPAGSYTAIVTGEGATTGVGLIEVYDLPQ